jgi:hypothetical protein
MGLPTKNIIGTGKLGVCGKIVFYWGFCSPYFLLGDSLCFLFFSGFGFANEFPQIF